MSATLSLQALNRAALDRQFLLRRSEVSPLAAIERLVALQAQDPNLPYYGLWTRLRDFRQKALTDLLYDRSVVRSSILRGTQHICTAEDFRWIRPLMQPVLRRTRQAAFGRVTKDWDLDELVTVAHELLHEQTLTRPQVARQLAERWPGRDLQALGWSVQALLLLVHPPPSGTWNTFGATPFALAEDWIGKPMASNPSSDELIRRYLTAFGPASVKDFQMWSGLRRMDADFERLRPNLRTFSDENGVELFDLPDAPLPAPDTPAPVRFLPELDNLILAYNDRTRMMTDEQRKAICIGAEVKATVLVDGRVHGIWNIKRDKKAQAAVLNIELFSPVLGHTRNEIEEEGVHLLTFTAPEVDHDIRFTSHPLRP